MSDLGRDEAGFHNLQKRQTNVGNWLTSAQQEGLLNLIDQFLMTPDCDILT